MGALERHKILSHCKIPRQLPIIQCNMSVKQGNVPESLYLIKFPWPTQYIVLSKSAYKNKFMRFLSDMIFDRELSAHGKEL